MDLLRTFRQSPNGFSWPATTLQAGSIMTDAERLAMYQRHTNVYMGRFRNAFPNNPAFARTDTTQANLAARAVDALKSAIWPRHPKVYADDAYIQLFGEDLISSAKNAEAISRNVSDTVLYGSGVLKVEIVNNRLVVRSLHPNLYFPELRPDNPEQPTAHNVIYEIGAEKDVTYYRRERYALNPETGTWFVTVTEFENKTGAETDPISVTDLKVTHCPIVYTYGTRLSGTYWGKAPLSDCLENVGEYAALLFKLGIITEQATTKALLAAPMDAFDDNGTLLWSTERPLMVGEDTMIHWDRNKYGWVTPAGSDLIAPNMDVLDRLERDVLAAFGLTKSLFGNDGFRDVGLPGLQRSMVLTEMTVRRYQSSYEIFLSDLINVAAEMARVWLSATLPDAYVPLTCKWDSFAPESDGERADALNKMLPLGLPKVQALKEMGYRNPDELLSLQRNEDAGLFEKPHTDFLDDVTDADNSRLIDR